MEDVAPPTLEETTTAMPTTPPSQLGRIGNTGNPPNSPAAAQAPSVEGGGRGEYSFMVPFRNEKEFVESLKRTMNKNTGGESERWRVADPETLKRLMQSRTMKNATAAAEGGEGSPSVASDRDAVVAMREGLFARCQAAIAQHVRLVIRHNLKSIDAVFEEMLVKRVSRQLAMWALHNIEPMDLRESYRDRVDAAKAEENPWLASRRERDAREFLKSMEGKLDGPLPSSNMMLQDWIESTGGVGGESGRMTGTKPKQEFAIRSIVTMLIRRLMEPAPARDGGAPIPRAVPQIMEHARALSTMDGVPIIREAEGGLPQIVIVRSERIRRLLGISGPTAAEGVGGAESSGESGEKGGHDVEEAKRIIGEWSALRATRNRNPREFLYEPMEHPEDIGASPVNTRGNAELLRELKREGENPEDRVKVGYEAKNRLAYYRQELIEEKTGVLPLRSRLPLKRSYQIVFLQQQRTSLDMATDWELAFNVLVPTCPMINLLLEGTSPDFMGSHAILDLYILLIWLAVDRTAVPGMRPPIPSVDELIRPPDYETETERWGPRNRAMLAFAPLREAASDKVWEGVPDWCGRWFLPPAYIPTVADESELDVLYPEGAPQRETVGRFYLEQAQIIRDAFARAPAASRESIPSVPEQMEAKITPTVVIDAFGRMCAAAEKQAKREREAAEAQRRQKERKESGGDAAGAAGAADQEMQEDGGDGEAKPAGSSSVETFEEYVESLNKAFTEPDRSRAGRAETLLVLSAIPAHYTFVQERIKEHNEKIDRIRERYGRGANCGNGYTNVRPADYYVELWRLCVEYTSALLLTAELTIMLLHSRWLDPEKARHRMLRPGARCEAALVMDASPVAVQRVLERREHSLRRRMMMDGRGPMLSRGLTRVTDREGRPVSGEAGEEALLGWLSERVPTLVANAQGSGVEAVVRPDAPTYMEMILFDTLLDYTPDLHEPQHSTAGHDHVEMNSLADRMAQMKMNMAREQTVDPDGMLADYDLPLETALEAERKALRKMRAEGGDRQTKRSPCVPFGGDDRGEGDYAEASGAGRAPAQKQKRTRSFEEAAEDHGMRISTDPQDPRQLQRVDRVRPDGTTTSSMNLD